MLEEMAYFALVRVSGSSFYGRSLDVPEAISISALNCLEGFGARYREYESNYRT